MIGGDIEIIHRTGEIEIAVGVEALDEGRALMAQIAFDFEVRVERERRQFAILQTPSELANAVPRPKDYVMCAAMRATPRPRRGCVPSSK